MEAETFTVSLPIEWLEQLTEDAELEGVTKEEIITAALQLFYS